MLSSSLPRFLSSPAFFADAERCLTSTGRRIPTVATNQRPLLLRRDLDRRLSSSLPPRSLGGGGGGFDPSEGIADAAEDLLTALRAEPESGSGSGNGNSSSSGDNSGRAAQRADELASDGMWPLYQFLGDFADLLDLAGRGLGDDDDETDDEIDDSILGGAGADAAALSLLRSHPSLLLLSRSELARRLVLLKLAAGPGADAAALARKLPWLLSHEDPGEVLRRVLKQMLSLMPGVGGPRELGARLFGGSSSKEDGKKRRRCSSGDASQSWLTFSDLARGESRKLKVEEKTKRDDEREQRELEL